MKRMIPNLIFTSFLTIVLATPVFALDYDLDFNLDYRYTTECDTEYYGGTSYEDMYGSEYNYGGLNVVDFQESSGAEYTPNVVSTTTQSYSSNASTYDATVIYPDSGNGTTILQTSFTDYSSLTRSDGSIGTLRIPKLDITVKNYEGATSESMRKGVGHFSHTSAWDGNIGISGHNRGAAYNIGSIKNLKIGDIVEYTTIKGTRTYAVNFVGDISSTDWSRLNPTSDNRITLITCIDNQPTRRVCVQATER